MDFDPFEQYGGVGERLDRRWLLVVIQHPVTTEYDEARQQVEETLHASRASTCRHCGSGRTSTPAPTGRPTAYASSARPTTRRTSTSSGTCRPRISSGSLWCRVLVGNSSVGDQGGRVPRCSRGERRHRQPGRERGRNVVNIRHDRHAIMEASENSCPTVASQASTSTATVGGSPNRRRARDVPCLTIDKRLVVLRWLTGASSGSHRHRIRLRRAAQGSAVGSLATSAGATAQASASPYRDHTGLGSGDGRVSAVRSHLPRSATRPPTRTAGSTRGRLPITCERLPRSPNRRRNGRGGAVRRTRKRWWVCFEPHLVRSSGPPVYLGRRRFHRSGLARHVKPKLG